MAHVTNVTTVDELRARLAKKSPAELRHIVNMGRLHAKLAKKSQKKHGLTLQERALKDRLEQTRLGI